MRSGGGADACWMLVRNAGGVWSTNACILVLLSYLNLACLVSFCFFLSTYFFFCLIFFLFIGKWASSILGGPCILLPSIRVHRSLYRNSIQPRRTFFSKMAPNLDFRRSRPRITIDLANQKPNLVNSYTTGDRIDGTATISVDHDIRFDDIDITFEGIYNSSN